MRFRLLRGFHMSYGPSGPHHIYRQGDVVESDRDLAARDPQKFKAVAERKPVESPRPVEAPAAVSRPEPAPVPAASDKNPGGSPARVGATVEADPAPVPPEAPARQEPVPTAEELKSMTVPQLRQYAKDRGISLKGVYREDDLIARIRGTDKPE